MAAFESPHIFTTRAEELPLSGQVLLDLMQEVLAKGTPFRFMARGWSMNPFIRDRDVITIEPIKKRQPSIGEVVAFTHPETMKLVVHRIVAKRGDYALILGDSIPDHPDGAIPKKYLLGRVTQIERDHHHIWLGLGPERFLIAWLSRAKLLLPLRIRLARWRGKLFRRDFTK